MVNPPLQLASNSAPSVISPPSRAQFPHFTQPPASSGDIKKQSPTEKLKQQILTRNPQLTAEQAAFFIQKLRASNNGKLSGLSLQTIFQRVETLMREAGLARREVVESECSICMEVMLPGVKKVRKLPCSHSFHSNCINVSKLHTIFTALNLCSPAINGNLSSGLASHSQWCRQHVSPVQEVHSRRE